MMAKDKQKTPQDGNKGDKILSNAKVEILHWKKEKAMSYL